MVAGMNAAICRQYRAGQPISSLAHEFRISATTVRDVLYAGGVVMRKRGRRPGVYGGYVARMQTAQQQAIKILKLRHKWSDAAIASAFGLRGAAKRQALASYNMSHAISMVGPPIYLTKAQRSV